MKMTKPRLRNLLPTFIGLALLLAFSTSIAYAYFGAGMRAFVVETPSMGTYAPVGTLVISKPASESVKVNDTILFHPSGQSKTYFHRVHELRGGGIFTAGDLTREQDPWMLSKQNLVGVEAFRLVNAGWLFKASPVLLGGLLLLGVYLRFFAAKFWRLPSMIFGLSTIFSLANYMFHPFVQASLLDKSISAGVATIRFVNTGILPLDVHDGKRTSVLMQGELFVSHAKLFKGDSYSISSLPHVEVWQLALFIILALIPSIVSFGYFVHQRASGGDWLYVPIKGDVPEGQLLNQSDQVVIDGKAYPRYISEDYEAQGYWLEGVENLTMEQLSQRMLASAFR